MTEIVQKLLLKYPEEPHIADRKQRIAAVADCYQQLKDKWMCRVPPRWYGFDLYDVPRRWIYIIDDFLGYLVAADPGLEIHQIKIKFGGLRFYVAVDRSLQPDIEALETALYDARLVY